jgi:hypothetical protein
LENDVSEQYPIILGSFARAIKPEGVWWQIK